MLSERILNNANIENLVKQNWLTPVVLGLAGVSYLHGPNSGLPWFIGAVAASGFGLLLGQQTAYRVAPLILVTCLLRYVGGTASVWPLQFLLPIIAALVIARCFTRLRPAQPFLPFGSLSKPATVAGVLLGGIAVAVLFGWRAAVDPDLLNNLAVEKGGSLILAAITALGFAFINATVEEVYFRGILQATVSHGPDAIHTPVVLQGLFFGLIHLAPTSVPHGVSGVLLTAAFGIALGYFRVLSRGLAAPIVAHLIADLGVFLIISSS